MLAQLHEVKVPDIGDFEDVEVVELLVASGDTVAVDQSLITLESDKASMEIPSPTSGIVAELRVAVGDTVVEGNVILTLEVIDTESSARPSSGADPLTTFRQEPRAPEPEMASPAPPPREHVPEITAEPTDPATLPWASPSARKLARELGVDISTLVGSGRDGRLTRLDIEAGTQRATTAGSALPEMPVIDFTRFGEIEIQPLTRIQRLTGENLHRAWLHVPHVTQFDEADISDLETFRKASKATAEALGFKLTFVSFMIAAAAAALEKFPRFNSSLDPAGGGLVAKRYVHIGVAVDTPKGLVVPVIRDAEQKRVLELAEELADVSKRARDGKLTPSDIQGASFTISSLGGIGGTAFTPIVNAPEVAILGLSRAQMRPVWRDGEFVPRLMLPLSLSYDHRVIDGAAAARFTTYLAGLLSGIRNLLL